jgi:hypothetical protein
MQTDVSQLVKDQLLSSITQILKSKLHINVAATLKKTELIPQNGK